MRSSVMVMAVMPRSYLVPMEGMMVSNIADTIFGFRPRVWAMALVMSTS